MILRIGKVKFLLRHLIVQHSAQFLLVYAFLGLFNSVTLKLYPPLFVDEAWLAARAWGFLKTGNAFGPLDAGVADRFPIHTHFFSFFTTFFQSLLLRFYNTPEILPLRIISLAFGMILLGCVYLLGKRLHSHAMGLVGMIFTAFSWPFFSSAHLGRQDVFVAACGFAAVTIYIYNNNSFWYGFLSGLMVGLAFEMHANGIIFGIALVGLYFYDHKWSTFRNHNILGMVFGSVLMIFLFIFWHILPNPPSYFELYQLEFSHTHIPPILSMDLKVLLQSTIQTINPWMFFFPFTLPLLLAWPILKKRQKWLSDHTKIYLLATMLYLGAVLFIRNKLDYYIILISPSFSLLFALFVFEIKNRYSKNHHVKSIRHFLLSMLILSNLIFFSIILNLTKGRLDIISLDPIRSVVHHHDRVLGSQNYWLPLYENEYYSWFQVNLHQRLNPHSSLTSSLFEFKPDIIILDGYTDLFVSSEPFPDPYFEFHRIDYSELEAFLYQHAYLITKMSHDNTRVYRVNWPND